MDVWIRNCSQFLSFETKWVLGQHLFPVYYNEVRLESFETILTETYMYIINLELHSLINKFVEL